MAVPKYKRSISKRLYFYKYKQIKKEVISLLLKDFGIQRVYIGNYTSPSWMIEHYRANVMNSLSTISSYIARAHALFPNTEEIRHEQLILQNRAIQEMFVLYETLQFCSDIFEIENINLYTMLAESIMEEITLLKEWRKYTSKLVF